MYKVSFHSTHDGTVDTGTYLVCAPNSEAAESMVSVAAEIPPSSTKFETCRVKPSIYELSRREFVISKAGEQSQSGDEKGAVHEVRASAKVFAYSESSVIRRFAAALVENASASKIALSRHINDFSIEIDRADHRPRPSRVEEQSIYREKRFFAGGAGRPR